MKKSQASMELIIYISIMIIIFGIAALSAANRQNEIYGERILADARNVLNAAVTEMDLATSVGDGYSHVFALPDTLSGLNYTIHVNNFYQLAYIEWSDKNYSLPLTTSSVNGSFLKGMNKVSNHGGMITIERPVDI